MRKSRGALAAGLPRRSPPRARPARGSRRSRRRRRRCRRSPRRPRCRRSRSSAAASIAFQPAAMPSRMGSAIMRAAPRAPAGRDSRCAPTRRVAVPRRDEQLRERLVARAQEAEAAAAPAPQERGDLVRRGLGPRRAHAGHDEAPGGEAEQGEELARSPPARRARARRRRGRRRPPPRASACARAGVASRQRSLEDDGHEGRDDRRPSAVEPLEARRRRRRAAQVRASPRRRGQRPRRRRPSGTGAA